MRIHQRRIQMQRLNFTLDDSTISLLDRLSRNHYHGNKSLTVRAALEGLAANIGHAGWIIGGYIPVEPEGEAECHTCGRRRQEGEIYYRPVFERGESPRAMEMIPEETWLDCHSCVERQFAS